MNKAQRKARLKHLNNIRTGKYFKEKIRAQQKAKMVKLLLPKKKASRIPVLSKGKYVNRTGFPPHMYSEQRTAYHQYSIFLENE